MNDDQKEAVISLAQKQLGDDVNEDTLIKLLPALTLAFKEGQKTSTLATNERVLFSSIATLNSDLYSPVVSSKDKIWIALQLISFEIALLRLQNASKSNTIAPGQ